jgi:hypothetical protein
MELATTHQLAARIPMVVSILIAPVDAPQRPQTQRVSHQHKA